MSLHVKIRPEAQKERERIREYELVILGTLIGIIGNLIANILDNLIRTKHNDYPLVYIILLIIVFLLIIYLTLKKLFDWKILLFRSKRTLKKNTKIQVKTLINPLQF